MSEEALFFRQAAEAIVATSLNAANVDPTIRELLSRIKYVNPELQSGPGPQTARTAHSNSRQLETDVQSVNSHPASNENAVPLPTTNKQFLEYFGDPLNPNISATISAPLLDNQNESLLDAPSPKKPTKLGRVDKVHPESSSDTITNNTDEKRFPCAKCNLIFRRSSDLRRHERTHLPVLPNICSQCGKGFARKDALKRHFNTLTCKRNRNKLLSIGGDINEILERARHSGTGV